jgi:CheY-like chemotaxis protein
VTNTPNLQPSNFEEFIGQLRSALHYLYDPVHLRRSLLVEWLGQSSAPDRAAALQRVLTDAIHALQPPEDEVAQSSAWAIYDLLNLQYIRQYERNVVASQLGVSERQLRREQRLALEALAQYLWQKFSLDSLKPIPEPIEPEPTIEQASNLKTELGWLKNSQVEEQGTLQDLLQSVKTLANPLAEQCGVTLHFKIEPRLEQIPSPQASLRSILLTILNALIPRVEKNSIFFAISQAGADIQILVSSANVRVPSDSSREEINLKTAQQLAAYYDARLEYSYSALGFQASLRFTLPEQVPILVIDDNADWLDMLKRYAVGTRYQIFTTNDPRAAAELVSKIQPALIFLDVMMPNVDGWQIFSELRHVGSTSEVPIIICSILPLNDLALSLGVNAFLQKPITQSQFIAAIEQQLGMNE